MDNEKLMLERDLQDLESLISDIEEYSSINTLDPSYDMELELWNILTKERDKLKEKLLAV